MKKVWFISCGVGLTFLVATVFAADKKQSTPAEAAAKVEELAKQVDSLQAKIKELEQRLAKMEKTKSKVVVSVAPATLPTVILPRASQPHDPIANSFADPSRPPKIWGEGECNGWKYYTIPLSANERATTSLIPLAGETLNGK